MVVKKSPIAKSRLHRIDIDQGNFSLERVEADLRAGEARLAQEGALDQGALLVRADLDNKGNVRCLVFEGDARLKKEVEKSLRSGRSKSRVRVTTLRSPAAILKD